MKIFACLFSLLLLTIPVTAQNVGIGTNTPVNRLSVNGKVDISDSLAIGKNFPTRRLDVNGDALINAVNIGTGPGLSSANTVFGSNAFFSNITGIDNTSIGYLTLFNNTTGMDNTAFGAYTLNGNTDGIGNTAMGSSALTTDVHGSNNTVLGAGADIGPGGLFNATAIGANALVTASNSLVLGDGNTNVGIGQHIANSKLDIKGNLRTTDLQIQTGAINNYILSSNASGTGSWTNPAALETDPKKGTLNVNSVPRWNSTSLANGVITDNGTSIGVGTNTYTATLNVLNAGAGVRVLSGANTNTSYQIGRTAAEASWGVAAAGGQYSTSAAAGDIIIRTESASNNIIFTNGGAHSGIIANAGNIGIDLPGLLPLNTLEAGHTLAVGAGYVRSLVADGGAIIQGNVGIGTSAPVGGMLDVANFTNKLTTGANFMGYFTTNENILTGVPFGMKIGMSGGTSVDNRAVQFQTGEMAIGGNSYGVLALQPDSGRVGIGTYNPAIALDVNGFIHTVYSGSFITTGTATDYDLFLPYNGCPPLPASWNNTNTFVYAMNADGTYGYVTGNTIVNSTRIHFYLDPITTGGNKRYNFIIFHL